MSVKERLKTAYENVAFNADHTWIYDSLIFQKANQELFTKERHLQLVKTIELRPRTVKDCIPESKLAQYSNYEYNEARELSYAPNCSSFNTLIYYSRNPQNCSNKEPWLLPEVDDLFVWFTNYHHFASQLSSNSLENLKPTKTSCFTYEYIDYESPILKADTFDLRILKMQICSGKVKDIWNINKVLPDHTVTIKEDILDIYKSPSGLLCLSQNDIRNKEQRRKDIVTKIKLEDFESMKDLLKSFKKRNCWILKHVMAHQTSFIDLKANIDLDERQPVLPSKRLYSAVLQGISGNIKPARPKGEKLVPVLNVFGQTAPAISSPIDSDISCDMTLTSQHTSLCIQDSSTTCGSQGNSNTKEQFHDTLPQVSKQVNNRAKNLDTNTSFASFVNSSTLTGSFTNNLQPPVTYSAFTTSFPNSINVVSPQYLNTHNYHFNAPFRNNYQNSFFYSSTFTTNFPQIIVNRSIQSLPNSNCLSPSMIMMQQNRTATLYPLSHQYMQQSFYPPSISCPRAIQRWLQPDYTRSPSISSSTYPSTISPNFISQPPVHWTGQNNYGLDTNSQSLESQICKIRNKLRRSVPSVLNVPHTKMKHKTVGSGNINLSADDYIRGSPQVVNPLGKMPPVDERQRTVSSNDKSPEQEFSEMSDVSNETTGDLLMNTSRNLYVSMISSFSEELETQAIEQYCTSGPDVYQELEKQAEEQYEHQSENWISPPKIEVYFGGLDHFTEVMYRL